MKYFLTQNSVLKRLETPSVYHIKKDDLYELDDDSFAFLQSCSSENGCTSSLNEFIDYCMKEGILTRVNILLKRPLLLKSPVPSLRYLELQITNRCNLKCKHCFIGDRPNISPSPLPLKAGSRGVRNKFSELSVSRVRTILKEFEELQGLRVLITGGEPLVHTHFDKINAMLPDFFLRKVLFTNGLLLNKKTLKNLNVDEIQVSIDGLENAHDALRGKGTFKLALTAVRRAVDAAFDVSVATMVHPGNLGDFDELDRLFRETGIKDWTVDIPCATGRLHDNREFQISPEQGGKYLGYGYGGGIHSGTSGFACGLHLMAVMADGKTAKCSFFSDWSAGRIEDGLRECWQKIKHVRLDELACDCEFIESCRGGCRYRAMLGGDILGKDLYKCDYYDKIYNKFPAVIPDSSMKGGVL